jgi:hypothetical protein
MKVVSAGTKPCTPPAASGDVPRPCLRAAASTRAAGARPQAAAMNKTRTGSARPSAPARSTAVSLRAVRLMPRSRSLTDRGLTLAASASSSCVSSASVRSCRSSPPKLSAGCSVMPGTPLRAGILPPASPARIRTASTTIIRAGPPDHAPLPRPARGPVAIPWVSCGRYVWAPGPAAGHSQDTPSTLPRCSRRSAPVLRSEGPGGGSMEDLS